jgi:small subunit ribosomal protein S3
MGQKINPIGLRLGINRTWDSRWYSSKGEYGKLLHEDMKIRDSLTKGLKQAAISKIVIERPHKKARINIHSARPGVVIGKKGADIEKLRKQVAKLTSSEVAINIVEVRKPEIDATLVAESIAQQLERRVAFRRAMKRAVQSAMRLGAEGIRINCSGRLGGAEIARLEWYREGRVPLHTLRADVDYGVATAHTAYGTCGIKVWIFKGEILEHDPMAQDKRLAEADRSRSGLNRAHRRKFTIMMQPKRSKFRKAFKGRIHGNAKGGYALNFGEFGLKAMEPERVTARQIEAARRALTRHMKRAGRVWIRVFPDVPVSKKPIEVRMGKGKGAPEWWIARIAPGRIMFEIDGVPETLAREAFDLAAAKLPIKTRFVQRIAE